MRDALSNVLLRRPEDDAEEATNRILAAAFFRKRPLQAGSSALTNVVPLGARKQSGEATMTRGTGVTRVTGTGVKSFLQGGERR
jgi:hypothetical protein